MLFWGWGSGEGRVWLEEAARALARSSTGLREYAEQWTETGTGEVLRPVWDTVGGWAGTPWRRLPGGP